MIALDEDALTCDFAETYHILNYMTLPVELAATLAAGLREDSRIMLKVLGLKASLKTLILAHIADNTAWNVYAKTKDAKTGRNKPKSMVEALQNDKKDDLRLFKSGKEFLEEWRRVNGD